MEARQPEEGEDGEDEKVVVDEEGELDEERGKRLVGGNKAVKTPRAPSFSS